MGRSAGTGLTILSNGHGEDALGARLARAFSERAPGVRVRAYPLVGAGAAYEAAGVEVLGERRVLPAGGLTFHSLPLLVGDLRAGLLGLTLGQALDLRRLRTDALLVVGDVWAQALGMLPAAGARFVLQPLISVRHAAGAPRPAPNRWLMERITPAERWLMRRALRVYTRDEPTARHLRAAGVPAARFLGNPAVDELEGEAPAALAGAGEVVALLPGTRGYAGEALALMLRALELLPGVVGAVAWGGGEPRPPLGWGLHPPPRAERGLVGELRNGGARALLFEGRFADLLHAARAALGTAGTAHEQAAALGVPVVAFPVPPHYTEAFLTNQRRLLGEALTLSRPDPAAIAADLSALLATPERRAAAAAAGRERMGGPGGSAAIARDLLAAAAELGLVWAER